MSQIYFDHMMKGSWLYEYKTIKCGSQRNSYSGYVFSSSYDLAW